MNYYEFCLLYTPCYISYNKLELNHLDGLFSRSWPFWWTDIWILSSQHWVHGKLIVLSRKYRSWACGCLELGLWKCQIIFYIIKWLACLVHWTILINAIKARFLCETKGWFGALLSNGQLLQQGFMWKLDWFKCQDLLLHAKMRLCSLPPDTLLPIKVDAC